MGDILVQQVSEISLPITEDFIKQLRLQIYPSIENGLKTCAFVSFDCWRFAVESEDDLEFDQDLAESEDYDEVEEEDVEEERDVDIEDRNLEDDMHMLDSGSISEVKAFCADPANAADPVCQVKM